MNIYKLTQTENRGYDTFDSSIVVAKTETEAKNIHPGAKWTHPDDDPWKDEWSDWASSPSNVTAELIGKADNSYTKPQTILASFNAV